jgi:hypothetical protein
MVLIAQKYDESKVDGESKVEESIMVKMNCNENKVADGIDDAQMLEVPDCIDDTHMLDGESKVENAARRNSNEKKFGDGIDVIMGE